MNNLSFRVLVADDEVAILDNYRAILGEKPWENHAALKGLEAEILPGVPDNDEPTPVFDVEYCSQGADAVDAVTRASEAGRPFSVAFLDVRMPPGMDGVEAARRMRQVDPNLHIVFVTGFSDKNPKQIARTVPPIDKLFYVNKPFQPAEIEQFAVALSRKWEVEQELTARCGELEQSNAALTEARVAAEAASTAKSAFMANMSHEFRTPLNVVVGYSDALLLGVKGKLKADLKDYITDINTAGLRLTKMVEDVFDVIQLQLDEIKLSSTAVQVDRTISGMIGGLKDDAAARKIDIQMDLKADDSSVMLDEARFRKSIYHLLQNAISFSAEGARVDVTSSRLNEFATIRIRDHGLGMTSEQLQQALQPFSQVDEALTRSHEGLGLGLPVAKQLLEKMGVQVEINSIPDAGTTVELTLPVAC